MVNLGLKGLKLGFATATLNFNNQNICQNTKAEIGFRFTLIIIIV